MGYQAGDETAKSAPRREREGFYKKYLTGRGIDIGHGGNPITPDCDGWEIDRGDATKLADIPNNVHDWVYSSHLLEHLEEPEVALMRWWDTLKPNGYLIVTVPDEDAYERGKWPSVLNPDHKFSYTIKKAKSLYPKSKNLADMLSALEGGKIEYIKTCTDNGEFQIEAVIQKVSVLSKKFIDSFYGGITCPMCQKDKLFFRGFYKNGNLLVRCILCGQSLTLNVSDVLRECGFTITPPKTFGISADTVPVLGDGEKEIKSD